MTHLAYRYINKILSYRRETALQGRGLDATYAVHLTFISKPVVVFLLAIIELFLLGVRAEALQVNIDWKSPLLKRLGQFGQKFHIEGE